MTGTFDPGKFSPRKSVPPSPPPEKEPVGETLRKARESRRLSMESVAKTLKIKAQYIEAIEGNNYDLLPGDVYIRVYLRSLSHYLSLDPEKTLERFFGERGVSGYDTLRKDSSTKINIATVKQKERPGAVIVIVIALIVALAASSFFLSRKNWHSSQAKNAPKASSEPVTKAGRAIAPEAAVPEKLSLTNPAVLKADSIRPPKANPKPSVVRVDTIQKRKSAVAAAQAPAPAIKAAGTGDTQFKTEPLEAKPVAAPPKDTNKNARVKTAVAADTAGKTGIQPLKPVAARSDDTLQKSKHPDVKAIAAAPPKDTNTPVPATTAGSADPEAKAKPPALKTPASQSGDTGKQASVPYKKPKDSLQKVVAPATKPATVFPVVDTGWQIPATLMKSKDSAHKARQRKSTAAHPKDSVNQAPPALHPDTTKTGHAVPDAAGPTAQTAPASEGKPMRLRMMVVADSAWARVFSDGRQWRKTVKKGNGITFTAHDSFNVHIGRNEAVAFLLNGKPLTIPGNGVMTFKVDKSGTTKWTLQKWSEVFQSRF